MAAVAVAVRRQEHISEGVDDVMVHLPPKESRLREGLVNKKIAAGGSGRWEPRHALYTEKMFSLSRPSANECIHALQFVSPFLLVVPCYDLISALRRESSPDCLD